MKLTLNQIIEIEKNNEVALYPKRGIALAKGKGIYLFDTNGKKYIDCITNIGVSILGYGNKEISSEIAEQLQLLPSTHQSFYSEERAKLLVAVSEILPKTLTKMIFTNSGAESIEAALKLAIIATGKKKFIAATNSYHGRSFGALAATGQEKYKTPFLPLSPEFTHVAFNDIAAIESAMTKDIAAILIEPIQGEAGVIVPDKMYLKKLRTLCDENNILLICDEIQTAIRTGSWLTSEQSNIVPDIVCLSKSFSYGLPFGIVATTETISNAIPKGAHGSTFAGNPLSCIAATNVITYIKKKHLLINVKNVGEYFIKNLKKIKSPLVKEVRGSGLLLAIELTQNATPYVKKMQDCGLLAIPTANNTIRFLPPIIYTEKNVDETIAIIKEVIT